MHLSATLFTNLKNLTARKLLVKGHHKSSGSPHSECAGCDPIPAAGQLTFNVTQKRIEMDFMFSQWGGVPSSAHGVAGVCSEHPTLQLGAAPEEKEPTDTLSNSRVWGLGQGWGMAKLAGFHQRINSS